MPITDCFGRTYREEEVIKITRRVTSAFLAAIPTHIKHFDAYLYAVVKRKEGKDQEGEWGTDVRIDPCIFDWQRKTIDIYVPKRINFGIESIDDLHPAFFEAIQAAFLTLMNGCLP